MRWRAENKTSAARRDIEDARAKEIQPPGLVKGADGMWRHPSAEAERIANEQKEANGQEKVNETGTEGVEHQGSQQPRTPADEGRLGAYQEALSASGAKSTDELNKESEREVRE